MTDLQNIKRAYFLGIGGIGMSAIARYFVSKGIEVAGYDKTASALTNQLSSENMSIHYEDNPELIPQHVDLVVYTPAVPKSLAEYRYLENKNIPILKRSEVLGIISSSHFTIAVAGTHGKTSVSSLIAHILHQAGKNVSAFIGGIMKNYHSNCIISKSTEIVVVEADEFDRSFLQLHPDILVITAIDADHLDVYGTTAELEKSFKEFIGQLRVGGKLIIEKSLEKLFPENKNKLTYGIKQDAMYKSQKAHIANGFQVFDLLSGQGSIKEIHFSLPGDYNKKNAAAAFAVAELMDVRRGTIRNALENFKGVERRFDIQLRNQKVVYIDDYAHHPNELSACINAVRTLFPDKKITGVFQPHLYSRTRDFADGFARSLEKLDEVILIPVYPAREYPIEGVSSRMIFAKMHIHKKYLFHKEELKENLKKFDIEVLLTLGAGDIDREVQPIKKMLQEKYS